jgi:hypothetical protein
MQFPRGELRFLELPRGKRSYIVGSIKQSSLWLRTDCAASVMIIAANPMRF